MRKEKLITRTITKTECEFMCLNVETAGVEIVKDTLIGNHDKKSALKAYKIIRENSTYKVVTCENCNPTTELYGMSETEFVGHAHRLPPRN